MRIAVIGSGISGLTAAHVLSRTHEVTLFEADDRIGGHAHTHDVTSAGRSLRIDTGFIVHNERTYPHLLRLFPALEVPTQPPEPPGAKREPSALLRECERGRFADPTRRAGDQDDAVLKAHWGSLERLRGRPGGSENEPKLRGRALRPGLHWSRVRLSG